MNRISPIFQWGLPILFCIGACACSTKYNDPPESEKKLPENDLVSVKIDVPAIVWTTGASPLSAYLNIRIENTTDNPASARLVCLTGSQLKNLCDTAYMADSLFRIVQDIYRKGGAVLTEHPTASDLAALALRLGTVLPFDPNSLPGEPFCEYYAFNREAAAFQLIRLSGGNSLPALHVDQPFFVRNIQDSTERIIGSGDSLTEERVFHPEFNAYRYGKQADGIATWVNRNTGNGSETGLPTGSLAGSARSVTFQYPFGCPSATNADDMSSCFTVRYLIYSLYSFSDAADYYIISRRISGDNADMKRPAWEERDMNAYGFYLSGLDLNQTLSGTQQAALVAASPMSGLSGAPIQSVIDFSLGGSCGLPDSSIVNNATLSWQNSRTVPGLSVTHTVLPGPASPQWIYRFEKPRIEGDLWACWLLPAPDAALKEFEINDTWIWKIANPGRETQYRMEVEHTGLYGFSLSRNIGNGFEYQHLSSGYSFREQIRLPKPIREMPQ